MIQYACDTCLAVKQPEEQWIVGLAAETVGATSARREINIQSVWSRETAVHLLAVHFCSAQCKDKYMAKLFVPDAQAVVERTTPPGKKISAKRHTTTTRGHRKRAA